MDGVLEMDIEAVEGERTRRGSRDALNDIGNTGISC